jgi:carboxypeptidase T
MKKPLFTTILFCSLMTSASPYSGVKDFLKNLAKNNPQTTTLFTLGKSSDNEEILGLKIGQGAVKHLVVATHHGNEYGSTEVAKAFAESLAKEPIKDRTVFVIPVLNTSGYNKGQRNEIGNDPNRDYPGPCGTAGPFRLKSTKALADLIDKEGIVASATLHTYYPGVLYPWGISTHDLVTPYESDFIYLAKLAAQDTGYTVGNSTEELYPADGTFEDYAFWKHGIWSLLFEMGFSHSPTQDQIKEMIKGNVPGLRRMMEQAPVTRAPDHEFHGQCDVRLRNLDRHDE